MLVGTYEAKHHLSILNWDAYDDDGDDDLSSGDIIIYHCSQRYLVW